MNSKYILLFLFSILFSKSFALVVQEIDIARPLKVSFSKTHGNRIAVSDGIVKKILGPPNVCSIRIEKESGQAFVNLLRPIKENVVFSIITGNGLVQDIEISFEDKISEVVILKEPLDEEEESLVHINDIQESAVKIVKGLLRQHIPKGFVFRDAGKYQRERNDMDLSFQLKSIIEGPLERVFIYEITNIRQKEQSICERFIKRRNDLWVFLEKKDLQPNEKTLAFIGEKKNCHE